MYYICKALHGQSPNPKRIWVESYERKITTFAEFINMEEAVDPTCLEEVIIVEAQDGQIIQRIIRIKEYSY